MRRITSLLLAVVLAVSLTAFFPTPVAAASEMTVSDALVEILKQEEGFCKYPVKDYSQYTVGYGSRCPSDMLEYYQKNGITEAEAELLLRNYLNNTVLEVNTRLIDKYGLKLTQGQFDALVSFSYNMGSGWMKAKPENSNILTQIINGATGNELIDALSRWCTANGTILSGLLRRRLSEANMYLNGQYARKAPGNYCYVYYKGNGGTTSQRLQGYDANLTALPYCVATYEDYTFDGWYTAAVGGTKVTKLDASTHKLTLYAHWKEIHNIDSDEAADPVEVTVTVEALNLRKGPGTNYAIVGSAGKGDKLTILQTLTVGEQVWGQYDGGWTCLAYTNYDEVIAGNANEEETTEPAEPGTTEPGATEPETTVPEVTEPETTVPEVTEPETTVPDVTEPETTVPDVTEPETTVPDVTEPETTVPDVTEPETTVPDVTEPETTAPPASKVMGTVISNNVLNVRSGPGTAYTVVKTLKPKASVQILEQKTVGSMIWGKTPDGWVSMTYIKLEEQESSTVTPPDTTTGTAQTTTTISGTVTCSTLNVRTGPGVSYALAATYKKGASVTVTATKTVDSTTWGKTAKGWVSMAYIKITGTTTSVTSPTSQTGTVVSDDVLRVRGGTGTSYAVVAYLKPNTAVTITETKKVGSTTWGKIEKGWVSMDYIKLDTKTDTGTTGSTADSGNSTTTAVTTRTGTVEVNGFLNVRSGAGTTYSVKGYYYDGDKVTITETKTVGSTEWGKTEKGWISMEYVKLDPLKDENGNVIYVVTKTVSVSMLNVRKGPGTGYDIVGYLYEDDKVEITEIKIVNEKAWGKTAQGWVSMAYLE